MYKLVPLLVEKYDFQLLMAPEDWETTNFWFVKPKKFPVRVRHRLPSC